MRSLILRAILCSMLFLLSGIRVCAAEADEETALPANDRKRLPVQSNETPGWPDGPAISAEAAILMDAGTGTVLYAKNIHEQLYPASTTKILTCLLAVENGDLTDEVTFSENAVMSLPPGSSNIGIDPGEAMPLETALYGILVGSANEVSNAVGEHIGGSLQNFVDMMNQKAAELGCVDSHFANTNGLPNEDHYTSAHDLAMIAKAFFDQPVLARISGTASYHFSATPKQKDDFTIRNKHKLVNGDIACEGIVGGKTGYTDLARETLVSCAERDGMRLICVVLKEESPLQFTDTATLFDYGFNNFRYARIASLEKRFIPESFAFAGSGYDLFGSSQPVLSFDDSSGIVLPAGVTLEDTDTEVLYEDDGWFARIDYSWHGVDLGSAGIIRHDTGNALTADRQGPPVLTIRLFSILPWIYGGVAVFCVLSVIASIIRSFQFGVASRDEKRRFRRRKRENRRESLHLDRE